MYTTDKWTHNGSDNVKPLMISVLNKKKPEKKKSQTKKDWETERQKMKEMENDFIEMEAKRAHDHPSAYWFHF